jgi:hypothetical protein
MSKAGDKKEIRKSGRGQHPNSRANLKPAQQGEVRNPEGRGHVPDRATVFRRWLDLKTRIPNVDKNGNRRFVSEADVIECTLLERAALGQLEAALKGNTQAWKEIQDSLHGKQAEKAEISGPDGEAIRHAHALDLTKLDGSELKALERILSKSTDAE